MVQGMLAVSVFCMFGVGFYIAYKIDQFLDIIQETEIIIFDRQAEEAEKILTITQSHDIISKTAEKGDRQDESEN